MKRERSVLCKRTLHKGNIFLGDGLFLCSWRLLGRSPPWTLTLGNLLDFVNKYSRLFIVVNVKKMIISYRVGIDVPFYYKIVLNGFYVDVVSHSVLQPRPWVSVLGVF